MVKKHLVTTALECTWPNKKKPILFLGEWCKRYDRKRVWDKLDTTTVPYHWDDRNKLKKDFDYLQSIQIFLMNDLAKQLNVIHNETHSELYWQIIAAPWLNIFSQQVFDRWCNLKNAFEEFEVDSCNVVQNSEASLPSFNMQEFSSVFSTDNWNEGLYSQLISRYFSDKLDIQIQRLNLEKTTSVKINSSLKPRHSVLKKALYFIILKANKWTLRNNEYFLFASYLPSLKEIELQVRLRQFPKKWLPVSFTKDQCDIVIQDRNWGNWINNTSDEFLIIMRDMLPLYFPKVYIEGYKELCLKAKKLPWPDKPHLIFTSNAFDSNELFKVWSAQKKENGSFLVIGQHGGHYGVADFSSNQNLEISISDYYFSWGWEDNNNVKAVGNFKEFDKQVKFDKNGPALLVLNNQPRYTYAINSTPLSSQWEYYFNDQYRFINHLPDKVCSNIKIRFGVRDYGWGLNKRFIDLDLGIKFDDRNKSVKETIGGCRLYISTTNATTYLESLSWNVPTVIFWNPEYWEINDEAKTYFDLLKSVGIFHETPESAARHIEDVWDNVDVWWDSELVQEARERFCVQYSNTPNNLLKKMSLVLKSIN
jgi:putative transferase (TIGR04331 family)